jgi:hypothetical protein
MRVHHDIELSFSHKVDNKKQWNERMQEGGAQSGGIFTD